MKVMKKPSFTKQIHLFPNAITAFGLICGLFIIFKMALSDVSSQNFEALQGAAIFLLLAATADLLDGAVARLMGAESEFGVFFDSVADSITFGVAPSVIIIKSMDLNSQFAFPLMITCMIFTLCGVLRLVRYSVQVQQCKDDEKLSNDHKNTFTGLPIPAAAAAAVSANLFLASEDCQKIIPINLEERAVILTVLMISLGYFMISRWKFPSLKALRIHIKAFPLIVSTVCTTALLLYGILNHFASVFVCVSWGYIVVAWSLSIIRLISGKKSNTLSEFEPASDSFDQ